MKKIFLILMLTVITVRSFAQRIEKIVSIHDTTSTFSKLETKVFTRVDSRWMQTERFIPDYEHDSFVIKKILWARFNKRYTAIHDTTIIQGAFIPYLKAYDSTVIVYYDSTYETQHDSSIYLKQEMQFGLWIQGGDLKISGKINLLKSMGATVGRVDLVLSTYNGGILDELKQMHDAGLKSNIILSWNNKAGGKFLRDTAEFKKKFQLFLYYNSWFDFSVTTEDEVCTDDFFDDDMQYYANELRITVEECNRFGIDASNSGDHIVYALALANGERTRKGNEQKVQYLLEQYRTIPMPYITLHNGSEQTPEDFKKAIEYIRAVSGIETLAMNAHVFKGADPSVVRPMVQLYKQYGFILFMPFDGNGTAKASSFHVQKTGTLTPWGEALKEFIKTPLLLHPD